MCGICAQVSLACAESCLGLGGMEDCVASASALARAATPTRIDARDGAAISEIDVIGLTAIEKSETVLVNAA